MHSLESYLTHLNTISAKLSPQYFLEYLKILK